MSNVSCFGQWTQARVCAVTPIVSLVGLLAGTECPKALRLLACALSARDGRPAGADYRLGQRTRVPTLACANNRRAGPKPESDWPGHSQPRSECRRGTPKLGPVPQPGSSTRVPRGMGEGGGGLGQPRGRVGASRRAQWHVYLRLLSRAQETPLEPTQWTCATLSAAEASTRCQDLACRHLVARIRVVSDGAGELYYSPPAPPLHTHTLIGLLVTGSCTPCETIDQFLPP